MRTKLRSTTLFVYLVLSAACTAVLEEKPPPADPSVTPNTGDTATEVALETATPITEPLPGMQAGTEAPAAEETPTLFAGPRETLMISNEGTTPFLVDDQGRSLYIYLNDSQHSGASACVDDCAVDWPPLTVEAPPVAGPGVDESLLGIIKRDDGSTQATYNGWPLYYYILDTIPGTTNSPNLNRLWFLVSPAGEPIRR